MLRKVFVGKDLRALWWLAWRQGRAELAIAATAVFMLGLGFTTHVAMLWPLVTVVVGIVFGTGVWGREQAEASYRFLTNQRLPPGRIWLVKTIFGAAAALATVACGLLGGLIHGWMTYARDPGSIAELMTALRLDAMVFFDNSPVVALIWLAHGFAAGQLLGLLCRKNLVAVMMALPTSLGLASVWLPSLISGGLPAWQVFVVPVLLLVACRLLFWGWATDNLVTRRPLVRLVGCGGLVMLWVTVCLSLRVVGVSDVGAPFDVEEFRLSLRGAEASEAGRLTQQALGELTGKLKEVNVFRQSEAGMEASDFSERMLRQGWEEAPPWLGSRLDAVFASEWPNHLAQAAKRPPGMLLDPRRVQTPTAVRELRGTRAPILLALRALQLLDRGEEEKALDCLTSLLGLSRNLRNKVPPDVYLTGVTAEEYALQVLRHWMARPPRPDLARRALDALAHHEDETPPATDALMADYLSAYQRLQDFFQELTAPRDPEATTGAWRGQLFALAQLTPWERARTDRLINRVYADYFSGSPPPRKKKRTLWERALRSPSAFKIRPEAVRGLCQVRAVHLQFALALFEQKKGRPARELAELVPDYLRAVPKDPFTGKPFGYRVSEGECWPIRFGWWQARFIGVAGDQGVLWSAGPEGRNDASTPQKVANEWTFVVPLWK